MSQMMTNPGDASPVTRTGGESLEVGAVDASGNPIQVSGQIDMNTGMPSQQTMQAPVQQIQPYQQAPTLTPQDMQAAQQLGIGIPPEMQAQIQPQVQPQQQQGLPSFATGQVGLRPALPPGAQTPRGADYSPQVQPAGQVPQVPMHPQIQQQQPPVPQQHYTVTPTPGASPAGPAAQPRDAQGRFVSPQANDPATMAADFNTTLARAALQQQGPPVNGVQMQPPGTPGSAPPVQPAAPDQQGSAEQLQVLSQKEIDSISEEAGEGSAALAKAVNDLIKSQNAIAQSVTGMQTQHAQTAQQQQHEQYLTQLTGQLAPVLAQMGVQPQDNREIVENATMFQEAARREGRFVLGEEALRYAAAAKYGAAQQSALNQQVISRSQMRDVVPSGAGTGAYHHQQTERAIHDASAGFLQQLNGMGF